MNRSFSSATLDTLIVFAVVFLAQQLGGLVDVGPAWFALALPVEHRPWTIVTSVYAHAGVAHLAVNATALALIGLAIERRTSRARFHAYVIATGGLAGLAEVFVADLVGQSVTVLGASGAIFGLLGYLVAGNRFTGGILSWIDAGRRVTLLAILTVAVFLTLVTGTPGAALVAHFAGLTLGLLAGRFRVLHVSET